MKEPLFRMKDLAPDEPGISDAILPGSIRCVLEPHNSLGRKNSEISEVIGPVGQNEVISFATEGSWSSHDLMFYLLDYTGPADVWFTTWSVSEGALRKMQKYLKRGTIQSLSGLFDERVKDRKPKVWQLATHACTEFKTAKIHAKVIVIQNEEWGITVIGSANMTDNPRIEAGTILTHHDTAEFHKTWIIAKMQHGKAF